MRFLTWLFGKRERPAAPSHVGKLPGSSAKPSVPRNKEGERPPAEAENLRRWRESGQARAWVDAHQARWGHTEWLALLEELKRTPYWPMQPDAVGLALEDAKREWLRRAHRPGGVRA